MLISDLFRRACLNLFRNKYRSILTVIATAFGSAAILTMISATGSVRDKVIDRFTNGTNVLNITVSELSKDNNNGNVTRDKLTVIKKISGVSNASVIYNIEYDGWVTSHDNKAKVNIEAVDMETLLNVKEYLKDGKPVVHINDGLVSGKGFGELLNASKQCEINLNNMNKNVDIIKLDVNINGMFKVDKPFLTEDIYKNDSGEYPTVIYIPIERLNQISNDFYIIKNKKFEVSIKELKYMDSVIKKLRQQGYEVNSIYEKIKSIKQFFLIIQLIMGLLGGITLVISATCTANTMNMSMMERKKEIGIFKAIGTKLSTIRLLFIIEASYIGIIGSFIGIALSVIFSIVINYIFTRNISTYSFQFGRLINNSLSLMLIVIIISILINIIASMSAVKKAIKIDALDVLRED